MYNFGSIKKSG